MTQVINLLQSLVEHVKSPITGPLLHAEILLVRPSFSGFNWATLDACKDVRDINEPYDEATNSAASY